MSVILDAHKQKKIREDIHCISSVDSLTDDYLRRVVKETLIEPIVFHFDRVSRSSRSESVDPSDVGGRGRWTRHGPIDRTVVTITLPFSGDRALLDITPSSCTTVFPHGEIVGQSVHFDVIIWDPNDTERIKREIEANFRLLRKYAETSASDVKTFNESVAADMEAAFQAKLNEIARQDAVFSSLGISSNQALKERNPAESIAGTATPRRTTQEVQQKVHVLYVEMINQMTLNTTNVSGDKISIEGAVTGSAIGRDAKVQAHDIGCFSASVDRSGCEPDLKQALKDARQAIEVAPLSEGDRIDAIDDLTKLKNELEKSERDRGRIKTIWDRIQGFLPACGEILGRFLKGYSEQ